MVDPAAYRWRDTSWHGRPWHEAVLYELHVGAFTPEGTFAAAAAKLDQLAALGILHEKPLHCAVPMLGRALRTEGSAKIDGLGPWSTSWTIEAA